MALLLFVFASFLHLNTTSFYLQQLIVESGYVILQSATFSLQSVQKEMQPLLSISQVPSTLALTLTFILYSFHIQKQTNKNKQTNKKALTIELVKERVDHLFIAF